MRGAFPKVYRSFEEFERDELGKLGMASTVEDMMDEMFAEELEFDEAPARAGRGRRRVRAETQS
jgi:hypothetical protein